MPELPEQGQREPLAEAEDVLTALFMDALSKPRNWYTSEAAVRMNVRHWLQVALSGSSQGEPEDQWRCDDCRCLNAWSESGCYRCGAGQPETSEPDPSRLLSQALSEEELAHLWRLLVGETRPVKGCATCRSIEAKVSAALADKEEK